MGDTDRFTVIAVDALGNGVSSSPSNSDGDFPDISVGDMVVSQHRLLTEVLGIERVDTVLGVSMGGMQACIPPMDTPSTVSTRSMPNTSVSRRCWLTTMSPTEISGKSPSELEGDEDTPLPSASTAITVNRSVSPNFPGPGKVGGHRPVHGDRG